MTPIPGGKQLKIESHSPSLCNQDDYVLTIQLATEITDGCDGLLVNTWDDLESEALGFLKDPGLSGNILHGKVFAVGPLVQGTTGENSSSSGGGRLLLDWLDQQPAQSVMYVSFGSGGSLSSQQMVELAWGMELSRTRFIWVVRQPIDNDSSSSEFFLSLGHGGDGRCSMDDYLPEGFLMRTQDVGLVVPLWAPQAKVLSHKSIGGFLTHCGWNSVMESILNGVPMIAWPLYAEQGLNAAMLIEDLKIAVGSGGANSDGFVGREEIGMMVKRIMEGEQSRAIRSRVKELQETALNALRVDGKGSSYSSQAEFSKLHGTKM